MIQVRQIQNSFFAVANYLITDDSADYCWLVDVGEIDKIKEAAEGKTIKGVFLTHSHHDHMFGINDLVESFPDCTIYLSEAGVEVLASDKLNFSKYVGPVVSYQGDNLITFDKETEVELFPGVLLSAIPTPGHSPDSVTYKVDGYLFTGDAFIPGTPVVTKLRGGDRKESIKSIEIIQSLLDKGIELCPGHWGKSHLPF